MSAENKNAIDVKLFQKTSYPILFAIAFSHLLNDLLQIIIPSVYPLLKENYSLSFTQIGFITFSYQLTASLLQPVVGFHTDKKPMPFSLRSEEHTLNSSHVRISYAVFCLKKKNK